MKLPRVPDREYLIFFFLNGEKEITLNLANIYYLFIRKHVRVRWSFLKTINSKNVSSNK